MILDEIMTDINWLRDNNTSNDLIGKLQTTDSLANKTYHLAYLVAEAYEKRNTAEYFYKTGVTSYIASATGAVGKAENEAKDKYKGLYKQYIDADSEHRKLSLLLSQATIVIEQSRQSNSYLKKEYNYETSR
jgi:hypothetical protein